MKGVPIGQAPIVHAAPIIVPANEYHVKDPDRNILEHQFIDPLMADLDASYSKHADPQLYGVWCSGLELCLDGMARNQTTAQYPLEIKRNNVQSYNLPVKPIVIKYGISEPYWYSPLPVLQP